MRRKMNAIPESEVAGLVSLLVQDENMAGPIMRGSGDLTLLCAGCTKPLLVNITPGQITDVWFRCACGTVNGMPTGA